MKPGEGAKKNQEHLVGSQAKQMKQIRRSSSK